MVQMAVAYKDMHIGGLVRVNQIMVPPHLQTRIFGFINKLSKLEYTFDKLHLGHNVPSMHEVLKNLLNMEIN